MVGFNGDGFRLTLLAALGLLPIAACGGEAGGGSQTGGAGQSEGGASGGRGGAPANTGGLTGVGGSSGASSHPCLEPRVSASDPTGSTIYCEGGWKHRAASTVCPSLLPRDTVFPDSQFPDLDNCHRDSECLDRPHGYCEAPSSGEQLPPANLCQYGCTEDSDCGAGRICECGDPIGTCTQGTCSADTDCGSGLLCASYKAMPGCDFPAFACQSTADQCMLDSECGNLSRCTVTGGGFRACRDASCVIGRPFLVQGVERMASVRTRGDWLEPPRALDIRELGAEVRLVLADAWTKIARMEHASVAAFARFSLELMAVGAPRELLRAASRAMADEVEHAALAFGLASAYAGEPRGPGALAVDGCLDRVDLEACVIGAFIEGCVGESVAALEAAEALSTSTEPAVREVLARVAEDESRHALLAWQFVKWALLERPELGNALLSTVERALVEARSTAAPRTEYEAVLKQHGVLPETRRLELRSELLRQVILPCLELLIRQGRSPRERVAA